MTLRSINVTTPRRNVLLNTEHELERLEVAKKRKISFFTKKRKMSFYLSLLVWKEEFGYVSVIFNLEPINLVNNRGYVFKY